MTAIRRLLFTGTVAAIGGVSFFLLGLPLPFLLGAMSATALLQTLRSDPLPAPQGVTQFAQSLIGVSIGCSFSLSFYQSLIGLAVPLIVYLLSVMVLGLVSGILLFKLSDLDGMTALFCCVPGGASEMISYSEAYGADSRIVATYHTARIVLIIVSMTFLAPWLAGSPSAGSTAGGAGNSLDLFAFWTPVLLVIGTLAWWLSTRIRFRAASFLLAVLLGVIGNGVLFHLDKAPLTFTMIGQMLLGISVGSKFDRATWIRIVRLGKTMMLVMMFTLLISLGIGYLFYRVTSAGLVTSLLATIPGGAAEMATIALTLGCDVTLVATIQMIRLFTMFMVAPGMTIWLGRRLAARETEGKG
ncbi:AbrB family transcriptional regulator [Planifilum fimeticola]